MIKMVEPNDVDFDSRIWDCLQLLPILDDYSRVARACIILDLPEGDHPLNTTDLFAYPITIYASRSNG